VPRQIEGNDAKMLGDRRIVHQCPELPPVGPRRMQAEERDAGAGLLDIEPMRPALELKAEIAADGGLEAGDRRGCHAASGLARGKASSSLKYLRLAIKGC
jgi:hypothetical protein